MANTRPIRTRRWRPWKRRKIPESRIAKATQWYPIQTSCGPVQLNDEEKLCTEAPSFGNLDLVPAGVADSAVAAGQIVSVHSVDALVVVNRTLAASDDCVSVPMAEPLLLGAASIHVRWILRKWDEQEFGGAATVWGQSNPFWQADPFHNSVSPGGHPYSAIADKTADDPAIMFGERVSIAKLTMNQMVGFPATGSPCVGGYPAFLNPDNEQDNGTDFIAQVGFIADPHVRFRVRKSFRIPLKLRPTEKLTIVVGVKSWFSETIVPWQATVWGRAKYSTDLGAGAPPDDRRTRGVVEAFHVKRHRPYGLWGAPCATYTELGWADARSPP